MRRQYSNTQNAVWNTIDLAALRDIGAGEADREAYYLAIRKFLEQASEGIRTIKKLNDNSMQPTP